ncbi:subunit length determinant protein [Arcticibacter tournemirensis]|uniref:Lipopolysaccharide biosynthesis protein n=1 Tax=Arcticibacter tournemirensis TaxID=699437 RepID=A0A5M9HCP4_9SPHI|nr:Wzz/FepE/Etk N-terminal domain-containing protein [Arcticibacter tournemirensis]KAA8484653.1 lipopolysaccharide biosynthesis protein [Arcticibacter tournemirensis]TQM47056.1 subunit length determinant protein [Arcticibacter tournemirensis]
MNTTVNKPDRQAQDDEISLKELILKLKEWYRYLLSRWRVIVLAGAIGGLLGFLYAYLKKPVYTAECTFVLEEQGNGGGLGQYAGIASMVGIDLGGAGSSGIFQGDNIIELYKSRSMIQKTLLSKGNFNDKQGLLINRYIEANGLKQEWAEKRELMEISFDIPKDQFNLQNDSVMGIIVNDIKKNYLTVSKPDKKLSIISVKVKSKDELFAKEFTDKIVENVNDFYIQTKTKRSLENLQILQKQADSVRHVLNLSIGGAAAAIDANPNANAAMQILRAPSQRRQVDVQASSAVYGEVVKNLEIAKISLRKETPLIQVVDRAVLPLEKDRTGKAKGIALGGFLFSFLTVIGFLFNKAYRKILE